MTPHPVKRRKKLIDVAIPLEAINAASAREKSIRHGHPSTLHLWWARRPLAAAQAVIFCQMVDDPSAVPDEFPTDVDQENERLRLFVLRFCLAQVSVEGDRASPPVYVSGVDWGLPGFGDTQITKNLQQLLAAGRAPH